MSRCNVSLRGGGLKVLTANNFIPSQTPILECRGKYMLGTGLTHRYERGVNRSGDDGTNSESWPI